MTPPLAVRLDPGHDPRLARVLAILRERVEQRCGTAVLECAGDPQVILALAEALPPEAFGCESQGAAVRIAGGSPRGLLYGVGKFLRTSQYEGGCTPSSWRGVSTPHGSLRGIYFANHFHNWYQMASDEELRRILEANASRQHSKAPASSADARQASELADAVARRRPDWARQGWRWEILHLRATLDRERFAGDGLQTDVAQAALRRLCDIYHCQLETDDPYHHRVRPPLRQAVSRRGQC